MQFGGCQVGKRRLLPTGLLRNLIEFIDRFSDSPFTVSCTEGPRAELSAAEAPPGSARRPRASAEAAGQTGPAFGIGFGDRYANIWNLE